MNKSHFSRFISLDRALLLLLFVFLLVLGKLILVSGIALLIHQTWVMDFVAYYTGGAMLAHHVQNNFYSLPTQYHWQHVISPSIAHKQLLPFLNPPFAALFFLPLAFLPLNQAYILWTILNSILFFFFCILLFISLSFVPKYIKITFIACTVTFLPFLTSLLLGQFEIILNLILFGTWYLLRKKWEFRSGLLLSLLLIKPHFIILPIIAFCVQRRFRMINGILLGSIVLFFISILLVGWQETIHYVTFLQQASSWTNQYSTDASTQFSLQTVLMSLTHTKTVSAVRTLWILATIIIVLIFCIIWYRKYSLRSPKFSLQWAALILATLITNPHTHFYDLSFLLVAAVAVIAGIKHTTSKSSLMRPITLLLSCGYVIVIAGFLFNIQTHLISRSLWIECCVGYMLIVLCWISIVITLKKW